MKPKELTQLAAGISHLKNKGLSSQAFFDLISLKKKTNDLIKDINEGFKGLMKEYGIEKYQIGWNPDGSVLLQLEKEHPQQNEVSEKLKVLMDHDFEVPISKMSKQEFHSATEGTELSMDDIVFLHDLFV